MLELIVLPVPILPPTQVEELLRETHTLAAVLRPLRGSATAPAGLLERLLPKRFKQYQKGVSSRA